MMDARNFAIDVLGTFAELGGHYDFQVALETLEEAAGSYTRLRELERGFLDFLEELFRGPHELPVKSDVVALVYEFLAYELSEELGFPVDAIVVYGNYAATSADVDAEELSQWVSEEPETAKEALEKLKDEGSEAARIARAIGVYEELVDALKEALASL